MRIQKLAMSILIQEVPDFSNAFVNHLLTHSMKVEANLVDQLFNSSEKRLARLLLQLSSYGSESYPQVIHAKINQEALAKMIGTTRSRVSYFMNRFRSLGLISYNGQILVHKGLQHVLYK